MVSLAYSEAMADAAFELAVSNMAQCETVRGGVSEKLCGR